MWLQPAWSLKCFNSNLWNRAIDLRWSVLHFIDQNPRPLKFVICQKSYQLIAEKGLEIRFLDSWNRVYLIPCYTDSWIFSFLEYNFYYVYWIVKIKRITCLVWIASNVNSLFTSGQTQVYYEDIVRVLLFFLLK